MIWKAQEAAKRKAAEELALRLLNEEGERRQRQLEKEERELAERKMESINAVGYRGPQPCYHAQRAVSIPLVTNPLEVMYWETTLIGSWNWLCLRCKVRMRVV